MQIYVNKNGKQIGPFTDETVLEMTKKGGLLPDDLCIRQGESEWRELSTLFKRVASNDSVQPQINDQTPPKKGKGCLTISGIGLIILSILLGIGGLGNYKMRNFNDFACDFAEKEKAKVDELFNKLSPDARNSKSEDLFRLSSSEREKVEEWQSKLKTLKTWDETCNSVRSTQSSWLVLTYLICGVALLMGLLGIGFASIGFLKKS